MFAKYLFYFIYFFLGKLVVRGEIRTREIFVDINFHHIDPLTLHCRSLSENSSGKLEENFS
jgi:hypothetical protein